MTLNKNIIYYSIFAYFLLIICAIYFKFFPILISSNISNFFILLLFVILIGILIVQSFELKSNIELFFVLPQYLIFTFLIRAIPTLRLNYQPLSDPYYYFITTLNIADYGTLEPILSWWYGLTNQQLSWPALHIIGSTMMNLTNIHSIELLRYILPAIGVLFFIGVFLFTKIITNNINIAILAGLFASTSDSVLFYQSEYHPQGMAFVFFIFLFVLIIRYFSSPSLLNGSLMIMYAIIFSISHHFSSIFFFLLSIFILLTFLVFQIYFSRSFKFNSAIHFNFFFLPWIIFAMLMLFLHIFKYPAFLKLVSNAIINEIKPPGTLITYGPDIPLEVTILNSTKYLLLILAIISIIFIYITKNKKEFFCFLIMSGILISGAIGTFVAFIPVDRLIGFYIPFTALFAALTLYRFYNNWLPKWNLKLKKLLILTVSLIILIAGPLNFFAPALIFHDSPKNPYYWHSNELSGLSVFGIPGNWIKKYIPERSSFSSYNDTFMIPYFYGQIPATIESSDEKHIADTYYINNKIELMKQQTPQKSGSGIITTNQIYIIGKYRIGINV